MIKLHHNAVLPIKNMCVPVFSLVLPLLISHVLDNISISSFLKRVSWHVSADMLSED